MVYAYEEPQSLTVLRQVQQQEPSAVSPAGRSGHKALLWIKQKPTLLAPLTEGMLVLWAGAAQAATMKFEKGLGIGKWQTETTSENEQGF